MHYLWRNHEQNNFHARISCGITMNKTKFPARNYLRHNHEQQNFPQPHSYAYWITHAHIPHSTPINYQIVSKQNSFDDYFSVHFPRTCHLFIHCFIDSLSNLFIVSLIHWFIVSLFHWFIERFIYLFICLWHNRERKQIYNSVLATSKKAADADAAPKTPTNQQMSSGHPLSPGQSTDSGELGLGLGLGLGLIVGQNTDSGQWVSECVRVRKPLPRLWRATSASISETWVSVRVGVRVRARVRF